MEWHDSLPRSSPSRDYLDRRLATHGLPTYKSAQLQAALALGTLVRVWVHTVHRGAQGCTAVHGRAGGSRPHIRDLTPHPLPSDPLII